MAQGVAPLRSWEPVVTDFEIQMAIREAPFMTTFHPKHQRRRARLRILVRTIMRHTRDPRVIAAYLKQHFAPGTAVSYAAIVQSLFPSIKTPVWKEAFNHLRQQKGKIPARKAKPLTPTQAQKLYRAFPNPAKMTFALMWCLANRHADMGAMKLQDVYRLNSEFSTLVFRFRIWKSDKYGQRNFVKMIDVPHSWVHTVRNIKWATYRVMHRLLKDMTMSGNTWCTPHSVRRGAITALAKVFDPFLILTLTGHTPLVETERTVREYVEVHPNQVYFRKQRRMSTFLLRQLRGQ